MLTRKEENSQINNLRSLKKNLKKEEHIDTFLTSGTERKETHILPISGIKQDIAINPADIKRKTREYYKQLYVHKF